MGETAIKAQGFGRRRTPRLRLAIPARLITLDRTFSIVLDDLSERGAKITLPAPHDFVVGVLRWLDFHGFADVRWREGLSVGLEFATPLAESVLEETRLHMPDLARLKQCAPGARSC